MPPKKPVPQPKKQPAPVSKAAAKTDETNFLEFTREINRGDDKEEFPEDDKMSEGSISENVSEIVAEPERFQFSLNYFCFSRANSAQQYISTLSVNNNLLWR